MRKTLKIFLVIIVVASCSKSKEEIKQISNDNNSFVISEYPSVSDYYKILEPSLYHGEDMEGIKADNWVGLYQNSNGYYLEVTDVFTRTFHDNIVDEPGYSSGKEVVVSNNQEQCKFVLGNFSWVTNNPRKVKSIDISKQYDEYKNFTFNFLSKNYSFNIKENGYVTISTEIKGKTIEQLICSRRFNKILFAGDLDNDGKLDLILDTAECDSSAKQITLFMSAQGESVIFELQAIHHSTSC